VLRAGRQREIKRRKPASPVLIDRNPAAGERRTVNFALAFAIWRVKADAKLVGTTKRSEPPSGRNHQGRLLALGDIAELDPMDEPGMPHGRLGIPAAIIRPASSMSRPVELARNFASNAARPRGNGQSGRGEQHG
jgi:hypothetical protein